VQVILWKRLPGRQKVWVAALRYTLIGHLIFFFTIFLGKTPACLTFYQASCVSLTQLATLSLRTPSFNQPIQLTSHQPISDESLIAALQQSSVKAFEEIYNRYWYRLYRFVYQETGTREEAEELVQDLFTSLWNRREQLAVRHLGAYLTVSIRNLTTNYIKSQITHRKYQEYSIMHEIRQASLTEETVYYADLARAVDEAMAKLPERTLAIFKLSRFERQSVRDIARTMNMTEKAVEYHITKSLKVMQAQLRVFQSDN
jgi:RNA polymerase sigma-70 factor (family 1)